MTNDLQGFETNARGALAAKSHALEEALATIDKLRRERRQIIELAQGGFIALWHDDSGDYYAGCPFCRLLANAAGEIGHSDNCPVKTETGAFGHVNNRGATNWSLR